MIHVPNPDDDQRGYVQPGAEFAYEVARDQLARALERVDRADTKAGILVGVLVAAVGAFLVLHLTLVARVVIGGPLMCSTILVTTALLTTRVTDAPDPAAVAHVIDAAPAEIKSALIPALVDAYEWTIRQATRKERYLKWALVVTLVGAIVALAIKIIRG